MGRYVNADNFIRDLQSEYHGMISDESLKIYQIIHRIDNEPTADVVEVKHGKWEEIKCGDGVFDYYFKCSNCGGTTPPKAFPVAPDYCPHCPAKMDGTPKERGVDE